MDAVILCGGKGTRLSEETIKKPKPMVEIGGKPIIWHIMKRYSHYGINRFILTLGYKGEYIKKYFHDYMITSADFSLKLDSNRGIKYFNNPKEKDREIVLVDTGEETLKGARIKRIEKHIKSEAFHLTYGDGVSDVNINELVKFHNSHDSLGTVTAVRPPSRFGELKINKYHSVLSLEEKPQMGKGLINGGFFVFEKEMLTYLTKNENCDFEFGPLQQIVKDGQLKAFEHHGFWQCMDTKRDHHNLEEFWRSGKAPWKH